MEHQSLHAKLFSLFARLSREFISLGNLAAETLLVCSLVFFVTDSLLIHHEFLPFQTVRTEVFSQFIVMSSLNACAVLLST